MHITSVIHAVISDYQKQGLVQTPEEVNQGQCDDFANDVAALLPEATIIGAEEFMMGSDGDPAEDEVFDWPLLREWGIAPPQGLTSEQVDAMGLGWHVWITLDGLHYDSECPDGVRSFFDLPCIKRQIAELAS